MKRILKYFVIAKKGINDEEESTIDYEIQAIRFDVSWNVNVLRQTAVDCVRGFFTSRAVMHGFLRF